MQVTRLREDYDGPAPGESIEGYLESMRLSRLSREVESKSTVTAKFKCASNETQGDGGSVVKLYPVTCGSPENESFYKWTPGGEIQLSTINPDAAKQFEVGKEYYVDFRPA